MGVPFTPTRARTNKIELKKSLDKKVHKIVSAKKTQLEYDEIMPELLKMEGRSLPVTSGIRRLDPRGRRCVHYSLRLLEILEVILEPLVEEVQKASHETALRNMITSDPKVTQSPKEYPNDYLSRILLDNYQHLLKLSTLYFNLSLSTLVTRFLVNLVYNLECWEIYHLLQAMPEFEYFLKLIGFEIVTTPFGHIVKPPENYLGFNLRQGLQYTFPFPFYNYSYHSTRPEARIEKYRKIHIEPYLDISLSTSKKGDRSKGLRFSSAIAERVLEHGFLLPFQTALKRNKRTKQYNLFETPLYPINIMSTEDIEEDYYKYYSENERDSDEDEMDDEEYLENVSAYFSDDEKRRNSMLTCHYKFVLSRFVKKNNTVYPQRSSVSAATPAKIDTNKYSGLTRQAPFDPVTVGSSDTGATKTANRSSRASFSHSALQYPSLAMKVSKSDGAHAYPQPVYNVASGNGGRSEADLSSLPKGSYASAEHSAALPNSQRYPSYSGPLMAQAYGPHHEDPSQLQAAGPQGVQRSVGPSVPKAGGQEAYIGQDQPRGEPILSMRDVPQLPSQSLLQMPINSGRKEQSQPSKLDTPSNMASSWSNTPGMVSAAGGMASGTGTTARPSQYGISGGYQSLGPARQEISDQSPQTGHPVAQIVTVPTYGLPPYNPYGTWIAPPIPGSDKKGDLKLAAEQQNMMMQGYRYPDPYNPYVGGYPAAYASMYQRPDQIYYTTGAANMGYAPHQGMMPQQYPYMGMYAQPYPPQMQTAPEEPSRMASTRKRQSLGGTSSAAKKPKDSKQKRPSKSNEE